MKLVSAEQTSVPAMAIFRSQRRQHQQRPRSSSICSSLSDSSIGVTDSMEEERAGAFEPPAQNNSNGDGGCDGGCVRMRISETEATCGTTPLSSQLHRNVDDDGNWDIFALDEVDMPMHCIVPSCTTTPMPLPTTTTLPIDMFASTTTTAAQDSAPNSIANHGSSRGVVSETASPSAAAAADLNVVEAEN
eukprot:scaffold5857_cov274-Alexandrium_tamarense.AAC.1